MLNPALAVGRYRFVLTAVAGAAPQGRRLEVSTTTLQSSASLTVVVNGPPRNGYITASPASGVPLTDPFTLSAVDWVDDETVGGRVPM